ncbi:hypothetical protein ID866_9035 [Astraeus odoratus]|nr:hypothetical protein ID866_9035 [Astraeus odoratus]
MDPPTQETSAAAIPAKARLMTNPSTNTAHVSLTRGNAKRGGKPGPGRSSAGLLTRNRSSLLTASKGKLTTVKGKFVSTKTTRDKSEQIEVSPPLDTGDIGLMAVSSMEEGVNIEDKCHGEHSPGGSHDLKPSETGLLKMAGVEKDANPLPDFDEDPATHDLPIQALAQEEQIQASEATTSSAEQAPATATAAELVATSSTLAAEQPSGTNTAVALEVTTIEDVAKKNLALATEQLFPSAQKMSFQAFSEPSTSFRSTIFGPLYQGTSIHTSNSGANDTGSSTSFKIIVNDTISIPLTLKDVNQMKGRMSDLRIGKSVNGRAGNFYGQNDALAIISALRSCGTARVVPEESADTEQQEHFATFLRQFELGRTFISAVGVDVYVLYLSENAAVVEQFSTPANLVGLSNTLLVARASIENQSVYAQAAYAAQAVVL